MNSAQQARRSKWRIPTWRLGGFIALLALAILALLARLIELQLVDGAYYRAAAQANQVRLIPVAAPRGLIVDRNGVVMARSRPSFVLALIPSEVRQPQRELTTVARIVDVPEAVLWKHLLHHRGIDYTSFDEVAADEPYGPVVLVKNLSVPAVARVSEVLSDLPGVDVEVQPQRDYPQGARGSHISGYVGAITQDEYEARKSEGYSPNDVIGKDGLEYTYDRYLRGSPGGERVIVDATGAVVPTAKLSARPAVPGDTLVTNVDWRLQRIVETALASGVTRLGRRISGAAVVENPWNGEILALASYPNYDPNDFTADRWKRVAFDLQDASQPLFDRAIAAATPTGSTFKMVTGSAALTEGIVKADQVIDDTGGWDCGGYYARDIAAGGLGDTTFVPALAASSDGYFFRLAWWLGNERLRRYALAFGLDAKSGIDLPGENEGNWPTNSWEMRTFGVPMEPSDACFLGIGQGAMQATPLQIVNVASAVINGGTLYKPRIMREIRTADGSFVERSTPAVIRQVPVTPSSLAAVRAGMARVTDPGGTAYGLAIDGLPYSGKTGTVETAGGNGPNTTWFVAWAPTKRPQLALAVFVDRSGGYGATVAAPIAREILVKYFNKKP